MRVFLALLRLIPKVFQLLDDAVRFLLLGTRSSAALKAEKPLPSKAARPLCGAEDHISTRKGCDAAGDGSSLSAISLARDTYAYRPLWRRAVP
jgi:hypothetical protein